MSTYRARTSHFAYATLMAVTAIGCDVKYVSMGDDSTAPNAGSSFQGTAITEVPNGTSAGGARATTTRTTTSRTDLPQGGARNQTVGSTLGGAHVTAGGKTASSAAGASFVVAGGMTARRDGDVGGTGGTATTTARRDSEVGGTGGTATTARRDSEVGGTGGTTSSTSTIATACRLTTESTLLGASRGQSCGSSMVCFNGTTSKLEDCATGPRDACWCSAESKVACGHGMCMPPAWRALPGVDDAPAFSAIRVGGTHALGLETATTVRSWGAGSYGQIGDNHYYDRPWATRALGEAITGIAAGENFSCAILPNKTVACWGRYIIGNDNVVNTSIPTVVEGPKNIVEIAASEQLACARSAIGEIYCWGADGQRGVSALTPIATLPDTIMLTAGCALQRNGTIQCWGANTAGQNGDGTMEYRATPVAVKGITTAVAISGKGLALLSDTTVRIWGGTTTADLAVPRTIADLVGVTKIARGTSHSCVVMNSGTVRCWGSNSMGQLGNGTYTDRAYPSAVVGLSLAIAIDAGKDSTCALVQGGTAYCWGSNHSGKLGNGFSWLTTLESPFAQDSTIPVKVTNAPAVLPSPS